MSYSDQEGPSRYQMRLPSTAHVVGARLLTLFPFSCHSVVSSPVPAYLLMILIYLST